MTVARIAGLDQLLQAYMLFEGMDAAARVEWVAARKSFKPNIGVPPFALGQSTITTFAAVYEVVLKIAELLAAGRFFGTQEDLGAACILSAFSGDAVKVARSALADAPESGQGTYKLHTALCALLTAYLQPRAAAEWRSLAASFEWPESFSAGWTEASRLYDLLCAISVLTQNAPNHVRRVAAPPWSLFLQLLEDVGPPWLVAALHGSAAANVVTKS